LLGAILLGALTVGFPFAFIGWGLVVTPASLYQVLMAMVPLLTLFLSALHGVEAISGRGIFGWLLAVAGIAITVGGRPTLSISPPHIAAIILAAAFIAEGGVLIKKFSPEISNHHQRGWYVGWRVDPRVGFSAQWITMESAFSSQDLGSFPLPGDLRFHCGFFDSRGTYSTHTQNFRYENDQCALTLPRLSCCPVECCKRIRIGTIML
jgi:drug/metabolite transporter (DMT)-like permease